MQNFRSYGAWSLFGKSLIVIDSDNLVWTLFIRHYQYVFHDKHFINQLLYGVATVNLTTPDSDDLKLLPSSLLS